MVLYHGSPNKEFTPEYGKGEDKHDYGRGFYLTQDKELAKEWAVCNPDSGNGWVHNIAKAFVRDEIDVCILEELFRMGDLGIQYCLKSEKAFSALKEDVQSLEAVDYHTFHEQFNIRDQAARRTMKELINSEKNKVTDVFSTLL